MDEIWDLIESVTEVFLPTLTLNDLLDKSLLLLCRPEYA